MRRSYRSLQDLLLAGTLVLIGWIQIGGPVRFSIQPESKLWIEGTSTLNDFTCTAAQIEGYGLLADDAAVTVATTRDRALQGSKARVAVRVPVHTFDCGKKRMNQDLYDALKVSAYPVIQYELVDAAVLSHANTDTGLYRLRITGRLSIAGVERRVEMTVAGERLPDGRLRSSGSLPLLMSDFGIDPPKALLGLIQASDRIVVHFDLIAAREADTLTDMGTAKASIQ